MAFIRRTLHSSGAETADGTGTAVAMPFGLDVAHFELDVTAAATAAGDLLDAYVQTQLQSGDWVDVVRFTQILGNGGAKRFITKIVNVLAQAEFNNATALGAAAVRHILGDQWRARWVVTSSSAPSFTFSLTMMGTVDAE